MLQGSRKAFDFTPDITPEEVLATIERNFSKNNPDIGKIQSCIIHNGPRSYKFAVLHEIIDRHTGEHHHNALALFTYKKLKEGWFFQEEKTLLSDEAIDEISLLELFINDFRSYTNQERKSYYILNEAEYERFRTYSNSTIGETIDGILEDPDNYSRIVEQGGLPLMKDIISWVFKQENTEAVISQLNTINIETLTELTAVAGISQINKVLELWNLNRENNNEEFWQQTFSEYSWIISQLFAAPVILYKEKAYVGGKTLDNKGGNLVDYIFKNKLSSNVVIVEIKTPCTAIVGKQYRQTYAMSDETSGAINQALNYKHHLQQNYLTIQMQQRGDTFEVLNPRTLLITGNLQKELTSDLRKLDAFELYRQNLKDVCILTYDELFSKVDILKSILQNGK